MRITGALLLLFLLTACAHDPWTRDDTKLAALSALSSTFDAYTTRNGDFDYYINPAMDHENIEVVIGITEVAVLITAYLSPKKLRRMILIGNITGRTFFSLRNLVEDGK